MKILVFKNLVLINMVWLVKCEFWENCGGFLWVLVIIGGIFLLLNLMGIIIVEVFGVCYGIYFGVSGELSNVMLCMDVGDMSKVGMVLDVVMYFLMVIIIVVFGFVVFFYCLGVLYDDCCDCSILFWKLLLIFDIGMVLFKVFSVIVLVLVIVVVVGIVVGMVQLLMVVIMFFFYGVNVWQLLMQVYLFCVMGNLFGYILVYVLWVLFLVGWFLFCLVWVCSKFFFWVVVLLVVIGLLIIWFGIMGLFNLFFIWFWKEIVLCGLFSVFFGGSFIVNIGSGYVLVINDGNGLDVMNFGQSWVVMIIVNLWIGVVVGIGLIVVVIWFCCWCDDS